MSEKDKVMRGEYGRVLIYAEVRRATEASTEEDVDSEVGLAEGQFVVRHGDQEVVMDTEPFYQALPHYDLDAFNPDAPGPVPFCDMKTNLGIEVHEAKKQAEFEAENEKEDSELGGSDSGEGDD